MAHAISVNLKSLELIATNNGGLKPEIELTKDGHPGSYFILPTDPNDSAEIVSIDHFFDNFEFVGPEALDAFRPIKPIIQFEAKTPYTIDRDFLAQMVAAHTSGYSDAVAEQEDYIIADDMLTLLEASLNG